MELSCGAASDLPNAVPWNCPGLKLDEVPLTTPANCYVFLDSDASFLTKELFCIKRVATAVALF
jgi:hypothetical protein